MSPRRCFSACTALSLSALALLLLPLFLEVGAEASPDRAVRAVAGYVASADRLAVAGPVSKGTTGPRRLSGVLPVSGDGNVHWNELGHDSRDPLYRSPGGAVPTGTPVRLRLRALDGDLTEARVRVWDDRFDTESFHEMTRVAGGVQFPGDPTSYEFWEATLPASAEPTVYWYRFIAQDGLATAYYEDDGARTGGWGQVFGSSPDNSWQLTVYDAAFTTPDWIKNAVVYQIFPDRFRDGNAANNPAAGAFFYGSNSTVFRSGGTDWNTAICDPRNHSGSSTTCDGIYSQNFYGGDLQGIVDRLDYLQGLGVTALYLNPIFESPSNHKYDTQDFLQVDDNFGTLADFQNLIAQADARGIKVILDGVFNHASSDSRYFDRYSRWDVGGNPTTVGANDGSGACESTTSSYANWFTFFTYTGTGTAPCSDNRDYPKWFGIFDSLPVLQHDDPEVRDYFINNGTASVGPYWISQGADGWRLDVAPEIDHGQIHDPGDDYWEAFRAAVRAVNPEAYIVGEEWGNATSWTIGGEWDATMNYQFAAAVLSFWRDTPFVDNDFHGSSSAGTLNPIGPGGVNERLLNLQERYAPEAWQAMMNLFGSHDTNRALFLLDHNTGSNNTALYSDPGYDWSDAITRLKGAVLMQMTLPGAPTVYYGDEVGTVNPPVYDGSQWQDDPYNRAPYPWLDASGTPFYAHMASAAAQDALRSHYSTLIGLRNGNAALRTGSFDPLLTSDAGDVYAYGRKLNDDTNAAVVVVNGSGSTQSVTVDVGGYLPVGATLTDALNGGSVTVAADGTVTVSAPARLGNVLLAPGFGGQRPAAVGDLAAAGASDRVELSWSAAVGATHYDVYRSRLSGGGWSLVGSTTATSYTDTGVADGTAYYYTLVARNDATGLEGARSNEAAATTSLAIGWANLQWPHTLTHTISATTPTENIYGQVWIDGVTNQAGPAPGVTAQVGYGPAGILPSDPAWTWFDMVYNVDAGNNDEYRGTLLPTSTGTFKYTTRWSTDGGATWLYTDQNGPPYEEGAAGVLTVNASSDTTPPAAPTNLVASAASSASITLGWDAHPNTDGDLFGFYVYREDASAPGFSRIATVNDAVATSYVDGTVTGGAHYNYHVVAFDDAFNASGPSNTVSAFAGRYVDVTFSVAVPAHTPGTVYVAGSFAGFAGSTYPAWDPGAIALTEASPNVWEVTLTLPEGQGFEYKYTRGSWDSVEKEADGNAEIGNRTLTVAVAGNAEQAVADAVANWRDPYVVSGTPADGATDLAPNTVVALTWNQAMQPDPGGAFTLTGPGGPVSGTFTYAGTTHTFTPDTPLQDGSYTAAVTGATDAAGDVQQVSYSATFTVTASAPVTSDVVATPNPVPLNTTIELTALVSDATGSVDVASAAYSLDGGANWHPMEAYDPTTSETATYDSPVEYVRVRFDPSIDGFPFTTAGLYEVCVRGTNVLGSEGAAACTMLAVYDPSAGFVTGAGAILSPAGAFVGNPDLTGEARFSFVSKYKQGKSTPEGNTHFRFETAGLVFASTSYEYLVVAGAKAQFKGCGLVGGAASPAGDAYRFLLAAADAEVSTSDGYTGDLFRIKIWYEQGGTEHVVYDNNLDGGCPSGTQEKAEPCTAITSGQILIHTGKGGKAAGKADDEALLAAGEAVPAEYALHASYPNPFNPSAEIAFDLPETGHVELVIYDAVGREVMRLVDGPLAAGTHRVTWQAEGLPSGVYLCRLVAGRFVETRPMTLVK